MPPKATRKPSSRVTKRASRTRGDKKSSASINLSTLTTPVTSAPATEMPQASSYTTPSSTTPGPVYFWKPTQGNGYLGQWYPTPFTVDGETYATAEMWMMVGKARLFGDEEIAKQIFETTDPKVHKALGRKVGGFDPEVWDTEKSRIVQEGNYHKFTISEDAGRLRVLLMTTWDRKLVEASPMDRIWGIGFAEKNAGANRARWGQNLLGKALMEVRSRLREEEQAKSKEGEQVGVVERAEGKEEEAKK